MSKSNFVPAEQVTVVNAKGTRVRVSAALASKMRGYTLANGKTQAAQTTTAVEGDPSESWTVKQLTAYAETNHIDLAGATRKGDILDVLAATADPDNDGQDDEDDDLDGPDDDEE